MTSRAMLLLAAVPAWISAPIGAAAALCAVLWRESFGRSMLLAAGLLTANIAVLAISAESYMRLSQELR
jgi:hypothetical protein